MEKVRAARNRRPRPARDEKILADWNGPAIAALAMAARAFGSREYLDAARRAAGFLLSRLMTGEGRLLHRYRDGDAAVTGVADDHACLGWGLLELHRATLETRFLEQAAAVTDGLIDHFWDTKEGGFFFTPDDGEGLIARLKPVHDGSTPSANSVALSNLLLLSRLTGRTRYLDAARDLERWYIRERASSALASTWMMESLSLSLTPSVEVVVVGDPLLADTRSLLQVINARGDSGIAVLLKDPAGDTALDALAPFTKGFVARRGTATAYVCRNHACELPVTDPESLAKILDDPPGSGPVGRG
jgi:uncharacterized protein YyaL (SSP411 family)